MRYNDKINSMGIEEKAELFASWTDIGACNQFGIEHERECDGKCKYCLIEWLESEVKK